MNDEPPRISSGKIIFHVELQWELLKLCFSILVVLKCFIRSFRSRLGHCLSFSQPISRSTVPRSMTRWTNSWRAFSQNRAANDLIMLHSVHYIHWWCIRMPTLIVSWPVAWEVSVAVVTHRPHATGFQRLCCGYRPDSLPFSHCLVLKSQLWGLFFYKAID